MKSSLLFLMLVTVITASATPGTLIREKDEKVKAIQLYPNPSYDGNITVSSSISEAVNFYLFDLDGNVVYQALLKGQNRVTITGLKKGTYMYQVLKKDENIEGGKIIIK